MTSNGRKRKSINFGCVCPLQLTRTCCHALCHNQAFANKEAYCQIWSLKGRTDRDHRLILATSMEMGRFRDIELDSGIKCIIGPNDLIKRFR